MLWIGCGPPLEVAKEDILFDVEWQEAYEHCADMEAYGLTDWRLPSVTEVVQLFAEPNQDRVAEEVRSRAGKGAWTCNEGGETALFAQPTKGPDVSYHWQYLFGEERVTGGGYLETSAVCVRGGRANCEPIRTSPTICLSARTPQGEGMVGIPFHGITKRGSNQSIGETNPEGWICVDGSKAEQEFSHILGCHLGLCMGIRAPFEGSDGVALRFPNGNVIE